MRSSLHVAMTIARSTTPSQYQSSAKNDSDEDSDAQGDFFEALLRISTEVSVPATGDEDSQTQKRNTCLCMCIGNASTSDDMCISTKKKNTNGLESSEEDPERKEERSCPMAILDRCDGNILKECSPKIKWLTANDNNKSPSKTIEKPDSDVSSSR